jgi:hypothetical protein
MLCFVYHNQKKYKMLTDKGVMYIANGDVFHPSRALTGY